MDYDEAGDIRFFKRVREDDVGIHIRMGNEVKVLKPGFHFFIPFMNYVMALDNTSGTYSYVTVKAVNKSSTEGELSFGTAEFGLTWYFYVDKRDLKKIYRVNDKIGIYELEKFKLALRKKIA